MNGFSPEAARLLLRHPWPGNVRELANAVERAAVLADGARIDAEDLPDEIARPTRGSGAWATGLPTSRERTSSRSSARRTATARRPRKGSASASRRSTAS